MKTVHLFLVLFMLSYGLFSQSPFIHVDQFGYTPNATKIAVLSSPEVGFNSSLNYSPSTSIELRNANTNAIVGVYNPLVWNNGNTDSVWSGDKGWWVDFSNVTTAGTYYLHDAQNNESSADFEIGYDVYDTVLETATKMYYYNRCNHSKEVPYAEANWTDGMNFDNALQDFNCRFVGSPNDASLERDLSGGWFDAGDYNKYTTFTMETIHALLWAYRYNPSLFTDNFNLPESGNGIPDLLDEIIWELDWLQKMSNLDGSAQIKMGSTNFNVNISSPPSANTDQRFYGPTCTSASLTVASVFAHAYFVLKDFPSLNSYANSLLTQAELCWNYVLPFYNTGTLELDCDDGSIVAGDADFNSEKYQEYFIGTAIYLFEATGKTAYNDFIVNEYQKSLVFGFDFNSTFDEQWGINYMMSKDAYVHYSTLPGNDATVANDFLTSFENAAINNNWEDYYGSSNIDLYRCYMPNYYLGWGSNSQQSSMGNLNLNVNRFVTSNSTPDSYRDKAAGHLHFLHGCNPLGKVFLSNMNNKGAENSADEIYHTWFSDGTDFDNVNTSLYGPAPGFLSGGPNHTYSGTSNPPANQPYYKSYADFNSGGSAVSWEITEPAIYYQAAYIKLLSAIMGVDQAPATSTVNISANDFDIEIFPNPTNDIFVIQGNLSLYNIDVIDAIGNVVLQINSSNQSEETIDLSSLSSGLHFVRLQHISNSNMFVQRIIKM